MITMLTYSHFHPSRQFTEADPVEHSLGAEAAPFYINGHLAKQLVLVPFLKPNMRVNRDEHAQTLVSISQGTSQLPPAGHPH